jgi:DNA-binding transcriptional MocR family regulator
MSWKPVIDRSEKVIYLALSKQLEHAIVSGILLPGTKLPPQRELADYLDINVSTVSKAFKVCELKGLLSATVGNGTFVAYGALSNAYLLSDRKPFGIIEMGATIPEPASYEPLAELLRKMLLEPGSTNWFGYHRPADNMWQKDAAAEFLRKGGFETTSNQILFANGGQNAIAATLAGLCHHGDKIGADPHTYPGLKTAAGMLGIQLIPIRQENGEMSAQALRDVCRNDGIKGIYIMPESHNPTTHRMTVDCRKALAQVARAENIFMIEDATYHMMYKEELFPLVASFAPERTILIKSLSKSLAPGLRLAYLSVQKPYQTQISNALYNMNVSQSPILAELAARAIVSGAADEMIREHLRKTVKYNQIVDQYFSQDICAGTDTSIFRWLKTPHAITAAEFERLALEHGVQVYGAERFAVGNTVPLRAVRLSVCAPENTEQLEQGLDILKKMIHTMK